jgi:serine/threonine protein kinase
MNAHFQRKYKIEEKIGEGTFSEIFKGLSLKNDEPIAIKIEKHLRTEEDGEIPIRILKRETTIINFVAKGCANVPKVHWFGNIEPNKSCLVMPFYEYSLYDWAQKTDVATRAPKIAGIRSRMLHILRQIHGKNVIHRDIKPHNFMVESGDLFLIDFGLATFYRDAEGRHIEDKISKDKTILGTPNYVSLFVHAGHTPSRRDDVISAEYVCMFLSGQLDLHEGAEIADIIEYKRRYLKMVKEDESLKGIQKAYTIGFLESPHY